MTPKTPRKILKFFEIGFCDTVIYTEPMDAHSNNQSDPKVMPTVDQEPLPLPQWLSVTPEPKSLISSNNRQLNRELNEVTYNAMFEHVIVKIAEGIPLKAILREDYRQPEYEHFLRWVHKDEQRKSRYFEAQEVGAEIIASELLEIADADDSLEDVARSTLRINTRKWLLGVWNRKRFGEVKQIEQNVTVDLLAAMEAADKRLAARDQNIIDITPNES